MSKRSRRFRRGRRGRTTSFVGQDDPCICGVVYRDFRTGMTYNEVYQMLYVGSDDRTKWKRKSRGVVLGKWHQIKKEVWDRHKWECEMSNEETVPF